MATIPILDPVHLLPALLRRRDRGQWRQGLRRQRHPRIGDRPCRGLGTVVRAALTRLLFQLDATGAGEPGVGRRASSCSSLVGLVSPLLSLVLLPAPCVADRRRLPDRGARSSAASRIGLRRHRLAVSSRATGGWLVVGVAVVARRADARHEHRRRSGRRRARRAGRSPRSPAGGSSSCGAGARRLAAPRRPGAGRDAARATVFAWPARCCWRTRSASPASALAMAVVIVAVSSS